MRIDRYGGVGRRLPPKLLPARVSSVTLGLRSCAAVALALACVAGAATARGAAKPQLTIGMSTGPESLDPAKNGTGPSQAWFSLFATPIIHVKPDGSFGPGLATSWHYFRTSAGANKGFEFTLRHDARFSDGTPVNAQAVVTWLKYFQSANGPALLFMGPVRSIQAVGKWTVRIQLMAPNPVVPLALSERGNWGDVESPKAVANASVLGSQTAGAGPYVLVPSQSVTNDHYTFVPNKYYFDKSAIRYSKIVVKIIPDPSSLLQAVKTGQVDVATGDTTTAASAASAGLKIVRVVPGVEGIVFLDRGGAVAKPLADPRVRQALNYAIDRKTITQAIQGGNGKPTSAIFAADAPLDPKLQNYYPYNPVKAKSLLAAAGYPNGFTFNVVGGTPQQDKLTPSVAKYLSAIGVTLKIGIPSSNPEWAQMVFSGTYSAVTTGTGNSPMWLFYQFFLGPKGPLNQHGWYDRTLENLWEQGSRAAKPAAYWKQLQERTVRQADFLPVFTYSDIYYVSKHVGGVVDSDVAYPLASEWFPK